MDFDIEGRSLSNTEANQRRNLAIKQLQTKNPGLRVSYTLPVDPTGVTRQSLALLRDAKAQGVKIESVNIMTMDYGANTANGKKMGDLAVAAANATHQQLAAIDPAIKIGLTPMIGVNDQKSEIFGLEDAGIVKDFAQKTDWVISVGFWSSNRDQAPAAAGARGGGNRSSGIPQQNWDFTNIFKSLSG
jgi:hypothetical protein